MLTLIIYLIIGSALVYVSKYNFVPVNLNLGYLVLNNIPLFYIVIGSVLLGLILSYVVHMINSISTTFTLRGKNNQIKKEKEEVLELTKRVHQLELENERIKHEPVVENDDQNAL